MVEEIIFFVIIFILCISLLIVAFKLCKESTEEPEPIILHDPIFHPNNPVEVQRPNVNRPNNGRTLAFLDVRQNLHRHLMSTSNRRDIDPPGSPFHYASLPSRNSNRSSSPIDAHMPESPNNASIPASPINRSSESIEHEPFVARSAAINISRNNANHSELPPPSYEEAMRRFNSV